MWTKTDGLNPAQFSITIFGLKNGHNGPTRLTLDIWYLVGNKDRITLIRLIISKRPRDNEVIHIKYCYDPDKRQTFQHFLRF